MGTTLGHRRQLDLAGLDELGEIALVGDEQDVTSQLGYFDAGATEVIASVFPAGDNGPASFQRIYELLETLALSVIFLRPTTVSCADATRPWLGETTRPDNCRRERVP